MNKYKRLAVVMIQIKLGDTEVQIIGGEGAQTTISIKGQAGVVTDSINCAIDTLIRSVSPLESGLNWAGEI